MILTGHNRSTQKNRHTAILLCHKSQKDCCDFEFWSLVLTSLLFGPLKSEVETYGKKKWLRSRQMDKTCNWKTTKITYVTTNFPKHCLLVVLNVVCKVKLRDVKKLKRVEMNCFEQLAEESNKLNDTAVGQNLYVDIERAVLQWNCCIGTGRVALVWNCDVDTGRSALVWNCDVDTGKSALVWNCDVDTGRAALVWNCNVDTGRAGLVWNCGVETGRAALVWNCDI